MSTVFISDKKLKAVQAIVTERTLLETLGKEGKSIIWKRTKSGQGVSGSSLTSLKPLSPDYIRQRQHIRLGSYGSPARSNLTLSGQMLDAITYFVSSSYVLLYIKDSFRSAIGKTKGRSIPQRLTNAELAEIVQKKRKFFAFSSGEKNILKETYRTTIKQKLMEVMR